ncbi:uncharacterized mitochondrial protein-like protein, partial [Tanacetum coccineum]
MALQPWQRPQMMMPIVFCNKDGQFAEPAEPSHYDAKHKLTARVCDPKILAAGNSLSFINEIKDKLHKEFSIKDLGPLNYYLGIGPLKGIIMTQRKYALDLIEQAGLRNTKHAKNPFDPNAKLTYEDGDLLPDPSIDKAQVGKLIYFTINRPDVAFAAQVM